MPRKLLKRILLTLLALGLLALIGVVSFYFLVKAEAFGPLPSSEELTEIRNAEASLVYGSDGQMIGRLFSENRTNTTFEELPPHLVNALIATEDARFYEHEGVDKRSMLRVVVKSILLGDESAGGGSTLTQQLAKNLYGRRSFGFLTMPVNKTKEMILANRLEDLYTKEQIIELYLNTVPFSENVYGIETASNRFFSKSPLQLNIEEAAVLVGILKANSYYNPRLNPENSLRRRNVVLAQMLKYNYLTAEEYDSLSQLPLQLDYMNLVNDARAPYFLSQVREQAQKILEEAGEDYNLYQDGLVIHTTLNVALQREAERAMRSHLAKLQEAFDRQFRKVDLWQRYPELLQAQLQRSRSFKNLNRRDLSEDSMNYYLSKAHPTLVYAAGRDSLMELSIRDSVAYYLKLLRGGFLAMNPDNGAVLSWVGGSDFRFMPYDHVLSKRQSASTFKPFVYATALERGVDPCDYISNDRRVYESYDNWSPGNYDNTYGGSYSMAGALKKSVNVAAVQTIFAAGVGNVVLQAREMGIETRLDDNPSIALGTESVSLWEMLRAYCVFANGGNRINPFIINSIENAAGDTIYLARSAAPRQVLSENTATLMNEMLQGVVNEGTATRLRTVYGLKGDWAGKTGTAQNYSDGWFIAYNPGIVAGAWVGASSPSLHFNSGSYGSGSAMALPIVGETLRQACVDEELKKLCLSNFPPPDEYILSQLDCPDFREDTFFDDLKGIFRKEEGRKVKGEKEKEGLFKRIFGGSDDDED